MGVNFDIGGRPPRPRYNVGSSSQRAQERPISAAKIVSVYEILYPNNQRKLVCKPRSSPQN